MTQISVYTVVNQIATRLHCQICHILITLNAIFLQVICAIRNANESLNSNSKEDKMSDCPNCGIEMTNHITAREVSATDCEGHEIDIGRVKISVCPKCNYYDEQTLLIHYRS